MSDRGKAQFTTMDMGGFGNTESGSSYSPGEMMNKGFSELDDNMLVEKGSFKRIGERIADEVGGVKDLLKGGEYIPSHVVGSTLLGTATGAGAGAASAKPGERLEGAKRGAIVGGTLGIAGAGASIGAKGRAIRRQSNEVSRHYDLAAKAQDAGDEAKASKLRDAGQALAGKIKSEDDMYADMIRGSYKRSSATGALTGAAAGASTRLKKEEKGFSELDDSLVIKAGYTSGRSGGTYFSSDDKQFKNAESDIRRQAAEREAASSRRAAANRAGELKRSEYMNDIAKVAFETERERRIANAEAYHKSVADYPKRVGKLNKVNNEYENVIGDMDKEVRKARAKSDMYKAGMEEAEKVGGKLAKSNRRLKIGAAIAGPVIAGGAYALGRRGSKTEEPETKGYKELDDTLVMKGIGHTLVTAADGALVGGAAGAGLGALSGDKDKDWNSVKRRAVIGGLAGAGLGAGVGGVIGYKHGKKADKIASGFKQAAEKHKEQAETLYKDAMDNQESLNKVRAKVERAKREQRDFDSQYDDLKRKIDRLSGQNKGYQELDDTLVMKGMENIEEKAFPGFEKTVMAARQQAGKHLQGMRDYVPRRRGIEVPVPAGKKPTAYDVPVKELDAVTRLKGERGNCKFKIGEQIKCSSGYKIKTKGIIRGTAIGSIAAIPVAIAGHSLGKRSGINSNYDKASEAYMREHYENNSEYKKARERQKQTGKNQLVRTFYPGETRIGDADDQVYGKAVEKGEVGSHMPRTARGAAMVFATPIISGIGSYYYGKKKQTKREPEYIEAGKSVARAHNEGNEAVMSGAKGKYHIMKPTIEHVGDLPDDTMSKGYLRDAAIVAGTGTIAGGLGYAAGKKKAKKMTRDDELFHQRQGYMEAMDDEERARNAGIYDKDNK